MRTFRGGAIVAMIALTGCMVTYNGLEPMNPPVGVIAKTSDSLRPTLRWSPDSTADSYDLIVWEAILTGGTRYKRGPEAYYREGVPQTEHTLETSLRPGHAYYWSVRARHGQTVGAWSTYNAYVFLLLGAVWGRNQDFIFMTPGPME